MAERLFNHLTIDGDEAKLDGAVIANLENNSEFSELKSGLSDSLSIYNGVFPVQRSADFTVNSGAVTSHELWKSLHLAAGSYILECEQSETLASVTRNTFGYKKTDASGFTYESSAANYNLRSGKRSWTVNITEEADYQFILWVNNPSADVTYSGIMFKSTQTKQDADIDTLRTLITDNTVEINTLNDALYDRSTDFTVNSGETTSHELWRSLHLAVGKYTLTCKQGSTLTSVTRNTFGYKKVGSTEFIYESSASGYNLSSGKRSWTFAVTEEADYQIILWVNNPSATVTYSEISICGESEVEKTVGVIVDRMPLYTIPTYFESNISDAITSIKANMDSVGRHGDTFVFITDLHWGRTYSNTENSPSLIQRLTEELPINLVVCGGDLIDSGNKELMVGFMTDCMKAFTSFLHGDFLVARGNHDSNQDGISDQTQWITADEFYRIALKDADYSITEYANDGYFDYYKDNPSTKTRYVVIDTGYAENMEQEQIDWVQSILDKNDDYKVLFFIHAVYENINGAGVWRGYTEKLFPILDSNKAKVYGIFAGHTHSNETLYTPGGIPVVITDTDSLRVAASSAKGTVDTATAGTITEQCMDVITVDYTAKTIKCVRIGRGASRTVPINT